MHVFQYIEMLKQVGVQEWIFREVNFNHHLYDLLLYIVLYTVHTTFLIIQVKQLREIKFKFKEKISPSTYSSSLSNTMQKLYPREWILSTSLIREYDPQLIKESLDLLRYDRFVLRLASQSFTGLDQRETWYGTEYKVEPLSNKLIQVTHHVSFFNIVIIIF